MAIAAQCERLGIPLTRAKLSSLTALADGVVDIVTQAASRRLVQVLELIHEEYIAPRYRRIAELEAEVRRLGGKV